MTYRAVGSSTGQKEFLGDSGSNNTALNHFGAGDIPMSSSRFATLTSNGRTMVHVPFAMGAIGVFHSVPADKLGGEPIHLTGCLLARIFSREITTWDHADIKAVNPKMTATGDIKVYHRVHGSSSTSGVTQYISDKCPAYWRDRGFSSGSTITWPAGTFEAQGSGGMAAAIKANENAIGYLDAGHGHSEGFGEIALLNRDNKYLTTKEATISNAAIPALASNGIPADPTSDWGSVNLYDQTGESTFPITMISYFYLEKDLSAMNKWSASLLMYFVKFILSDEGQALAQSYKFSRLPEAVRAYNNQTLESMIMPAGFTEMVTETAATAQPRVGAGKYVISGKRRNFGEYQRSKLDSDMEALLSARQSSTPPPPAFKFECISSFCFSENEVGGLLVASMIIACLSLILGFVGLLVGCSAMSQAKATQTRSPKEVGVTMTSSTDKA